MVWKERLIMQLKETDIKNIAINVTSGDITLENIIQGFRDSIESKEKEIDQFLQKFNLDEKSKIIITDLMQYVNQLRHYPNIIERKLMIKKIDLKQKL